VGGELQLFQRVNAETVMNAPRGPPPDARHAGESCSGLALAAQPLEHRQAAGRGELVDGARQALADTGQSHKAGDALLIEQLAHGLGRVADGAGGGPVGVDPIGVGLLIGEGLGDLIEPRGDMRVRDERPRCSIRLGHQLLQVFHEVAGNLRRSPALAICSSA